MNLSFLEVNLRRLYKWILNRVGDEYAEIDLRKRALVFAPHFDDETLGCGGIILKKKKCGADIKIIFMTDGSKSHHRFITEAELRAIRANEGVAAGQQLGLNQNDLVFLDFEETRLSEHLETAARKVAEIVLKYQPGEIFVPYYKDPMPDHIATNQIVMSALQISKNATVVYEYPIWFWQHWPWASPPIRRRRALVRVLKNSLVSTLSLLKDFRYRIYIGDMLTLKRAALDQHKSQMTRLNPDPNWKILEDVSNGKFLECFFQDYEIFYRHLYRGNRINSPDLEGIKKC